ncbi:unnamed protein product [Symbiodinium sp. KB8]|nr:unnamed protein product [Symbiodinium sp. KB8]
MVAASFDEESAGAVFTWGCGQNGRLGYEAASTGLPRAVPWLTQELGDVLSDRLGQKMSSNADAGTPTLRASPPPRPSRRLPQRITQVSCGLRHTALICQGSLVCFGADDYGQLGRAGEELTRPKLPPFAYCPKLEAPDGARTKEVCARRICCGPLHTAAVCSQGCVHIWGIDLCKTNDPGAKAPRRGPQPVSEFGPERPVVALTCGAHFVVCSAELALPRPDPENPNVSQEDLLLGFCDANSPGVGSSVTSWRPAHLPPKAEEESEHHRSLVRALERNVQRRLLQEQREEQQRRQREERRERRLQEHTDVWLHELLPSFVPGMEPTQRMQRLWRQGLPPRVREVVWPVAIGNVLRITPELFEIHKQRAVDARRAQVTASNVLITLTDAPPHRGREQSTTCIPFDLPRTFPTLAFFSEGGPLHEDCARILEAYTFFRPDIGYVQGMSYLAAMLLLYLPPYESFVGLCNLLNTPSVLGLYRLEPRAVACRARVFEQLCSQQLPDVCRCIREVGLMPEMFLIDWFLTVFAKCLTVDVASVVWDLFLLDGEVVLYCTAIAILRILEFQLLHPDGRRGLNAAEPDLESCTRVLNEELRKRVSDPDELLWHIAQVRRRAPQRIFGEIRAIENMEFGSQGRVSTRGSIASALTGASFLTAAKERILSRLQQAFDAYGMHPIDSCNAVRLQLSEGAAVWCNFGNGQPPTAAPKVMDKSRFVELLKGLQTSENAVRQQAETMYQTAKQAEPDNLIIGMMAVLGSADVPEGVRRHDCVLLRQLVTRGAEKDFVYARITDAHKQEVAAELLRQYEQEKLPAIQKKIGEVISKLADYVCDTDDPRASLGAPSGWPALLPQVFRMADTSTATSVESCESALRLLKDCVPTLKDQIVAAKQQLGQIIQNGLASPQVKHKVATFLLVCEIVTETEKKAWAPLLSTVSVLVQSSVDAFFLGELLVSPMSARAVGRSARALWLRNDLRLDDNLALKAAAEGAESLLPVFVFDPSRFNVPTLAGARKCNARRARFLLESVDSLRRRLESIGSGLAVALGPPQEVIPKLCDGCSAVAVTQGYCSEEQREEALVAKRLRTMGAELTTVWGGTLYMPEECGQNPRNTPLLFTSFKNKAEGRGQIRSPVPAPKQLPSLPKKQGELETALGFLPTLQQLGYDDSEVAEAMQDDPRGVLPFRGGEDAALARLQKWMFDDDHLKDYFDIRNGMLGEGYSSKLSPWLALGCISPRRIWSEAQRYETERRIKNKSTYWLIFELTWRDFFIYMALSQGDKIFVPGGVTGDRTPWRGSPDKLERWKEGKTGDPLVDANMRELGATGFMSNRGRQNVASFLIFDLGVDWRYGAAHFEEYLLDYDPCSNWGNWVAAAGLTGQRINKFNTKKQLSDYDPQREYVNHWLRGERKAVLRPGPNSEADKGYGRGKGKDHRDRDGAGEGGGKRGRWTRSEKGKGKGAGGQKRSFYSQEDDRMEVLTALAQAKDENLLQECIQAFTDVATVEPDFFKAQLQQTMEPAKFMATVARTREIDSGLRGLAIEWLVSFVEKRSKFLSKSAPDFINLTLECCMSLMLEVDESEDKLKVGRARHRTHFGI